MKIPVGFNSADYQSDFVAIKEGVYNFIIKPGDVTFRERPDGGYSMAIKATITSEGQFKGNFINLFFNNYSLPSNHPDIERMGWDLNAIARIVRATNNGKDFEFNDTDLIENKPFTGEVKTRKNQEGTKTYYDLKNCKPIENGFGGMPSQGSNPFTQSQVASNAQNSNVAPWANGSVPF